MNKTPKKCLENETIALVDYNTYTLKSMEMNGV